VVEFTAETWEPIPCDRVEEAVEVVGPQGGAADLSARDPG
jgi:hypothetical protein